MKDFALDPSTGDLLFENFGFTFVDGVNQVSQNLAIRLRFILGEWFLNTLAGLPYYQYFFIKNPNQIQVETFLKNEISNTRSVTEITSFSSTFDGQSRLFTVVFGCKALDETIEMELDIP